VAHASIGIEGSISAVVELFISDTLRPRTSEKIEFKKDKASHLY
jgi:hypothetical protein